MRPSTFTRRVIRTFMTISCACVVSVSGCGDSTNPLVNQLNLEKLQHRMTEADVNAILGKPSDQTTAYTFHGLEASGGEPTTILAIDQTFNVYRGSGMILVVPFAEGMISGKIMVQERDQLREFTPSDTPENDEWP